MESRADFWVGLDIGGTKLSASLVFGDGAPVNLGYINLPSLYDLKAKASELLNGYKLEDARGIGVGVAGWVSTTSSSVLLSPHRPELADLQITDLLSDGSLTRIVVENDANCAALAEVDSALGLFSVTINFGTGIGMAALYEGQLFKGANGLFGELGHCFVGGSLVCECGAIGCLEAELRSCFICESDDPQTVTWKMRRYIELAARGVGWVIRILNPAEVVVGGGVPLAWSNFLEELSLEISRYIPSNQSFALPSFRNATYQEYSGSVGAAILAQRIFD